MRTVCLCGLNGLIVLWGILACLLVSGGRELLAAPGDCDKECRTPSTFGSYDGMVNSCAQLEFPDCRFCTDAGCNSNVAKSEGTCQEDKTTKQKHDVDLKCTIYCNKITKNMFHEATTTKKKEDFKFEDSGLNVFKCLPKTGGL